MPQAHARLCLPLRWPEALSALGLSRRKLFVWIWFTSVGSDEGWMIEAAAMRCVRTDEVLPWARETETLGEERH